MTSDQAFSVELSAPPWNIVRTNTVQEYNSLFQAVATFTSQ